MGTPNIKSTYSKSFQLKKWFPYFKNNADNTKIYIVLIVLVEFIIQKKAELLKTINITFYGYGYFELRRERISTLL